MTIFGQVPFQFCQASDVIDTSTNKIVGFLPSMWNTRKELEIDWQNSVPIATSERQGLGYSTSAPNVLPTSTAVPTGKARITPGTETEMYFTYCLYQKRVVC